MTDEAYVFNETNRERAITRRSASHKRSGSKSKKCTLEVDKMSNKQIEKQHGPISTWNLNDLYTYAEFCSMPKHIQAEYLQHLMDKYSIGLSAISSKLFNHSPNSLYKYLKNHDVAQSLRLCKKPANSQIRQFEADIRAKFEPSDVTDTRTVREIAFGSDPEIEVEAQEFSTTYISSKFDESVIWLINSMFAGTKMRVTITVERA